MLGEGCPGSLPSTPLFSKPSRTKAAETGLKSFFSWGRVAGVTFKKMCVQYCGATVAMMEGKIRAQNRPYN